MKQNKKQIGAYFSMKKRIYDNDYYFYEDGTILHHYDRTMTKLDIEAYVILSTISDTEKANITERCKEECDEEIVN